MSLLNDLIWGAERPGPERLCRSPSPTSPGLPVNPEVALRVKAFRQQLTEWVESGRIGVPLLILPDAPAPEIGRCVSCGTPISEDGWRCHTCREAAYLALGKATPRGGEA